MFIPKSSGFTLIELMIAVALIGILAAITTAKVGHLLDRSNDAKTLGNLGALRAALASYYSETEGKYPAFPPPYTGAGGSYGPLLASALVPRYIDAIPEASESGNHHPSSNSVFHVWNQTGNEDDAGWKYDANPMDVGVYSGSAEFGSLLLLCTHVNAVGTNWSTY